ncbi:hypothetical protein BGW36DRAFT_387351 [Talaromyces proteolyticus]|uniref:Uncharacterized protein n=1 Tax=Talaromyces proteolyticus TaxID=1131652 RepID=A0AAD4KJ08_9EURO|nr:uncharacterized protein BGW36DRAFT_387351 [Talaromyces proteolyticus]KAH8692302.1 hypothetical protein BGW36DRAFT_387351 [Talaromyces proteolyticus]
MVSLLSTFLDKSIPENSLQYRCIKALTTSYYSMRASDIRAYEESMRTYSDALKGVRFAVARRPPQLEPDILMSIMCLCLYENIIVTRARSWIEHYIAISHMIEMQGPEYYQTGRNRDILLAFRYTIIVSAGTRRYHCFLAQKRWKSILEPRETESFNPFDTLLNIAVAVPGLLHDLDSFKNGTLWDERERTRLALRTGDMLVALQFWREASLPIWSLDDGSLQRHSHQVARAIAFHHMVVLLVEDLSYLFGVPWLPPTSLSLKSTPGLMKASATTGRAERKHVLATEILRLAELFISDDTAIYGVLTFIMSLHVAHDNLLQASPEMDAIRHLMNTVMAEQHGFNMARQYRGMYKAFENVSL